MTEAIRRAADGCFARRFGAKRWEPDSQPAVRSMPSPRCPYYGAESLVEAYGDNDQDTVQVELYCNNNQCAAREVKFLCNTRGEAGPRSDLRALADVDRGPATERNRHGYHAWSWRVATGDEADEARRRQALRRRGEAIPCECDECEGPEDDDPTDRPDDRALR